MLSQGSRDQKRVWRLLFQTWRKFSHGSSYSDNDDLLPVEGKDEAYDEIAEEIRELEEDLDKSLKKLEKQAGLILSYLSSTSLPPDARRSQMFPAILAQRTRQQGKYICAPASK